MRLLFEVLWLFWAGNKVWLNCEASGSNFDIPYSNLASPQRLNIKSFGSSILEFCCYSDQRTFQLNFNQDFEVCLPFLYRTHIFQERLTKFPDAEFNAEY